MLSVVLYGRNDSHGYNLHKRAAISLNAIAELLTDPDDEILFVDYNTPDDLPTFVEAISDTLTSKCVERLRVLRVRAETHRTRFAARTHLVALEPIARNVAARRSNPANRWILSTNTDMIFCPRRAGDSLSTIAAGLADGFYHLPRFELPEGLWETLDRKDGAGIIAKTRDWGERYHLNEIVHSGHDNLYDAPGDFQLFLREDLFAIGGFHEEMIRGWHLDANIARRMRILRGKVSSALDHLTGYHCDHTRLASTYHKADRQENDPVRFVDKVVEAQASEQMQTWGLADLDIEEFRLGEASGARYLAGLNKVVTEPSNAFTEAWYTPESYGGLNYSAAHVLPYLLDLVSCAPQDYVIGYVGARPDIFAGLAQGWAAMGGRKPVLIPEGAEWLKDAAPAAPVDSAPLAEWVERADMFIFEIGAEQAANQADLSTEEAARLWMVDDAFKTAAARDYERQQDGGAPRRAFVVNGVHNFFEPETFRSIALTLTPYSSRVRHGYFVDRVRSRAASASPVQAKMMAALGSLEPPPPAEIERLRQLAQAISAPAAKDADWAAAAQVGAEIAALAQASPGLLNEAALAALARRRPSRQAKAPVDLDAGREAANRLVRVEDWDDRAWAGVAARLYGNVEHGRLIERSDWMWERVSLTQNLLRDAPNRGTVLLAGVLPETHAFALAHMGFEVDIIAPESFATGSLKAVDWRAQFSQDGWVLNSRSVGLAEDRAQQIAEGFRYDAVLIMQNGLFYKDRSGIGRILQGAAALVRPGGHLGLSTRVRVGSASDSGHALPLAVMAEGRLADIIERHTAFELRGGIDGRLTPRTLDRIEGGETPPAPRLGEGGVLEATVPAVFALRRRPEARPENWDAVQAAIFQAAPSSRLESLFRLGRPTKPAGKTTAPSARFGRIMDKVVATREGSVEQRPTGLAVRAERGEVAAHVDLGPLGQGAYTIIMEAYVRQAVSGQPLMALGLVGPEGPVATHTATAERGPRRIDFQFDLPREKAGQDLQLQVKVLGGEFDILDLTLR